MLILTSGTHYDLQWVLLESIYFKWIKIIHTNIWKSVIQNHVRISLNDCYNFQSVQFILDNFNRLTKAVIDVVIFLKRQKCKARKTTSRKSTSWEMKNLLRFSDANWLHKRRPWTWFSDDIWLCEHDERLWWIKWSWYKLREKERELCDSNGKQLWQFANLSWHISDLDTFERLIPQLFHTEIHCAQ